jgi:transcriptional regulator with XRE-family HTH domain
MNKLREILAMQMDKRMKQNPNIDTQTKLAKAAKITQSTVWRALSKEAGVSIDVLESLASAFGVPAADLISSVSQSKSLSSVSSDESMLLNGWGRLSRDDRLKVLGFISIALLPKIDS